MDTKRSSRIPSMLDPFGFNVGNEPSPYDTALAYSANPNTRSRASFLGPSSAPGAIGGGGHGYGSFPSTTSMQSYASSSGGTSPVPWQGTGGSSSPGSMELEGGVSRPWAKQRSASAGDSISSGGRQQFRGSLVRPGNPSKLSGEIGIEVSRTHNRDYWARLQQELIVLHSAAFAGSFTHARRHPLTSARPDKVQAVSTHTESTKDVGEGACKSSGQGQSVKV